MSREIYQVVDRFEEVVAKYTEAPWAVATHSCTGALLISLKYKLLRGDIKEGDVIGLPRWTFPSVPNTVLQCKLQIEFYDNKEEGVLSGEYCLENSSDVWDSALMFTSGMYYPGTLRCLSFTGPRKILNLESGGMILTDNYDFYLWARRARNHGRREISYMEDTFDHVGYSGRHYMMPEHALRGLRAMGSIPKCNEDRSNPYPDLEKTFKPYVGL